MAEATTSGQATTDAATTTATETTATTTQAAPAAAATTTEAKQATTEATAKPAEAKPAEAKPAEAQAPGAPETYEFAEVEGVKFSDAVLGKYAEVAKSLNLTNDAAQKVLSEVGPVIVAEQQAQMKAVVDGWMAEAKGDKEFGGEKLNESLALAQKGIDAYFSPKFVQLLKESGFSNHPEMIRGMIKVGRLVSQDGFVAGNAGTASTAVKGSNEYYGQVFYGNSKK